MVLEEKYQQLLDEIKFHIIDIHKLNGLPVKINIVSYQSYFKTL